MKPERQETILVVSAIPERLAQLTAALGAAGYHTLTAEDGASGCERAARVRPSLVIGDVTPPATDGVELVGRLRADARLKCVPVILVSASHLETDTVVAAFSAGADDYLEASPDPLRLVVLAARHLERARVEEHYRDIVEGAGDIIFTADLSGRYTSINPAAERLTGYARDEILGMTWRELVAPEYHDLVSHMFARKTTGAAVSTHYEVEFVARGGRRVPVEIDSQLISEGGKFVGVQGIARDITERRHAEAAWHARAEQEAENEKMRSLGQLSAGVAHNFNNALTAIIGRTQMLLRQVTDERQLHSLRVIETAAFDAAEIVRRIQTFARRSTDAEAGLVSLSHIISDTLQLARTRWEDDARAAGVRYEVSFTNEAGPDDQIAASSSELREVFLNLVFNALDAMPQGGTLTLRERREDKEIVVEVSDTGSGIPAELQPRIFEPFFTTKGTQGSGLGLAVSYGTVVRHGGTITVESEVGCGATFAVRLPHHSSPSARGNGREVASLPRRRVLVVEDEVPVREVIADLLRELGQEVEVAADARRALAALSTSSFDLMITDLSMPDTDGLALAAAARRRAPHTRVALASGYVHTAHEEAVAAGLLDAVLRKPLQLPDLEAALRRLLVGSAAEPAE